MTSQLTDAPVSTRQLSSVQRITALEPIPDAEGPSALNEKVMREGIVIRPREEVRDSRIGRLSFKAISPEYLIKHGE